MQSTAEYRPETTRPAHVTLARLMAVAVALLTVSLPAAAQSDADDSGATRKKSRAKSGGDVGANEDAAGKKSKKDDLKPFPEGPLQKQFQEKLGGDFKVRHTDHFFVLYSADEEVVKDFILRIEATYAAVHRFATQMGVDIDYPKEKLPIVFCSEFDQYSSVAQALAGAPAPREAAGLYFPQPNFSLFYDMAHSVTVLDQTAQAKALQEEARRATDSKTKKEKSREAQFILNRLNDYQERNNKSVVQHEVAHQLLYNFQVHHRDAPNPVWFVEGLATLFEPPPGKTGAGFNVVNQYRLWRLREADAANALADLREFVQKPELLRGSGDQMDRGYAQAWGLMYYLSQKKKAELRQFVELIKTRKPREVIPPERELADFEKCFGKLDESFRKNWHKFLKSVPYRAPR